MRLFMDGATLDSMLRMHAEHGVTGFTTNPTLCRGAGVPDYLEHAKFLIDHLPDLPLSFEVTADDGPGMLRQAQQLTDVGTNLYVKIPVSHLDGERTHYVLKHLRDRGVKQNVTAITTTNQFKGAARVLAGGPPAFLSIFAGRIADSGIDPVPFVREAVEFIHTLQADNLSVIWASTREVLNLRQAQAVGCHIITVTEPILAKRTMLGTPLEDLSLQTIRMFHRDAQEAGYDF